MNAMVAFQVASMAQEQGDPDAESARSSRACRVRRMLQPGSNLGGHSQCHTSRIG